MIKYLVRLDDACPTMDIEKWGRIEEILERHNIKPMVGVIPNNEDPEQMISSEDTFFWEKVRSWASKKWAIALHGYNHCYSSFGGMQGLNPFWSRSEFAGLSLEEQKIKIRKGVSIMRQHGINPMYFFAPSHTFDENTLVALREESDIRIISDTIALKPYQYKDFIIVPQIGGHFMKIRLAGVWTFCLHPNIMTEEHFAQANRFISENKNLFISFTDLELNNLKGKSLLSKIMSYIYFLQRRIRGIE